MASETVPLIPNRFCPNPSPRPMPGGNERRRRELLLRVERILEVPMVGLAFVWLLLLVIDFVHGLSRVGQGVGDAIWVVFVVEFVGRLVVAPNKLRFVLKNWLTLLSLFLPALRILRPLRLLKIARGARVLRVVSSLNRGMRALSRAMGRRGFGYVVALTVLVAFGGAAGMFALERESPTGGFADYWDALWWTAMTLTTLGAPYTPATAEGRVLTLLLAIYAFSVFGYVAAFCLVLRRARLQISGGRHCGPRRPPAYPSGASRDPVGGRKGTGGASAATDRK